jgi:hypothetical protein
MFEKLALSLLLFLVATASAFGTQLAVSTSAASATTLAAKADRLIPALCETATWPHIPQSCLAQLGAKRLRVIAFGA